VEALKPTRCRNPSIRIVADDATFETIIKAARYRLRSLFAVLASEVTANGQWPETGAITSEPIGRIEAAVSYCVSRSDLLFNLLIYLDGYDQITEHTEVILPVAFVYPAVHALEAYSTALAERGDAAEQIARAHRIADTLCSARIGPLADVLG
jgi:hypothetical protein